MLTTTAVVSLLDDEMDVQQNLQSCRISEQEQHVDYASNSNPICKILTYSDRYPTDVLKWIKANAPPRQSLKLMKVCKYFKHRKFPYFTIQKLEACLNCYKYWTLDGQAHTVKGLENLSNNLWIVEEIRLYQQIDLKPLFQKITVCDAKYVIFHESCPKMLFEDFLFLTSSGNVQDLGLQETSVIYENGEVVPFEAILQCLPNIIAITLSHDVPPIRSLASAKKAVSSTMKFIEFTTSNVEVMHFDTFAAFMLQNQQIEYFVSLEYDSPDDEDPPIFSQNYMEYLRALVDHIIYTWSPINSPPIINFTEQFRPSYDYLNHLHHLHFELTNDKKS